MNSLEFQIVRWEKCWSKTPRGTHLCLYYNEPDKPLVSKITINLSCLIFFD